MALFMLLLVFLFFVTALLYASVGFGGGSTYNALLVLNGTDYRVLPAIALACNIIVVAGGVWRFGAAGHIRLGRIAPWIAASIPLAWVGGRLPVSEIVFVGLLGVSLAAAGVRMLVQREAPSPAEPAPQNPWLAAAFGGAVGFLSGVVGIGGGVFLAPILHLTRWGNARMIAGTCSLFIFVNSLSGLAGQLSKLGDALMLDDLAGYWMLAPAVLVGGQIGSYFGSSRLGEPVLRRLTALLVLYVAGRLLLRWATMTGG